MERRGEMTSQNPAWRLKCRFCERRYVDMITFRIGWCPKCKAKHEILVTPPEENPNCIVSMVRSMPKNIIDEKQSKYGHIVCSEKDCPCKNKEVSL